MIEEVIDNTIIKKWLKEYFDTNYQDDPFSKKYYYILNNASVAFIDYSIIYDRAELNYIFVKEEYRKLNIASLLMDYMINYIKENNIDSVTLEVNINNKPAIKLYQKYLFKQCGIRKNYYKNEDAYLMIRSVGD